MPTKTQNGTPEAMDEGGDENKLEENMNVSPAEPIIKENGTKKVKTNRYCYSCTQCSFKTSNNFRLVSHIQKWHSPSIAVNKPSRKATSFKTTFKRVPEPVGAKPGRFTCPSCSYRTNSAKSMEVHESKHRVKSDQQCPICTYSCKIVSHLSLHISRDHPDGAGRKAESLKELKEGTKSLKELKEGTKISKKLTKGTLFKCPSCDYATKAQSHMKRHNVRHHFRGKRTCPSCSYSSNSGAQIVRHIHECHQGEESLQVVVFKAEADESIHAAPELYHCPICPCRSRYVTSFHEHFLLHQKDPVFRCSACGLESKGRTTINTHIRKMKANADENGSHSEASPVLLQPVPAHRYESFRKPSDEGEQSVGMDPEDPLALSAEEPRATGGIPQDSLLMEREVEECQEQIDRAGRSMEASYKSLDEAQKELDEAVRRTEQLDLMRKRVQVMEEKVKTGAEEVEQLSIQKEAIRKEISETAGQKTKAKGEEEAKQLEDKLNILRGEDDQLSELIEDAEESRMGACQVLSILQAELNVLEAQAPAPGKATGTGGAGKRVSRLKANTGEKIRAYIHLEERLVEKMYRKSLMNLRQKEKRLLESLNRNYDGEDV